MKAYNKWQIAPDYNRIPHLNSVISNMTHDDIQLEEDISLPLECWVQEKVDGANMGISWLNNGPVLRNREHILKKGYSKIKTPAKQQFTSAWNWLHNNKEDIKKIEKICYSPITIYGEWLYASHSIYYDELPDLFIAYDIWNVEYNSYYSPEFFNKIMKETNIPYIKAEKVIFNSISEIIEFSEKKSEYYSGIREGIVIKIPDSKYPENCDKMFKIVNKYFNRRDNFNEKLIRNKIK